MSRGREVAQFLGWVTAGGAAALWKNVNGTVVALSLATVALAYSCDVRVDNRQNRQLDALDERVTTLESSAVEADE